MRILLAYLLLFFGLKSFAQTADTAAKKPWQTFYHATATKLSDLVHTKLDVSFDYEKARMLGKAWLTLHPHFYATDSLILDAKGLIFNEISMVSKGKNIPLKYAYNNLKVHIKLDKSYKASENYTVYINYISSPNDFKTPDSVLTKNEKGLYFINPTGAIKNKPIQIWTQGEMEANSCWVPTIDKPNQKTTDEISMTVPAKYVTLSNGLLISQKTNVDGTRTDTWKSDLPFAPYLLFMGVGDYAIIKDHYKNKEVNYYVEKEYASVAKRIFGNTPEMIAYFSKITGVDYPWQKYDQIVGRDYIFGAMENMSATLHEESSQQDARQLVDGNGWEEIVAHELFHQWFGDYVTAESWSNITVNESFADYSETLWNEYKYGKDAGQAHIYADLRTYLGRPNNATENLVRFNYENVMDAFDAVGYQKGGCILNMLRHYVGDSAFFKSLNLYLTTNKFKSAEAQNLRLAFEEVTGQDLNWFFNEWYYGSGHPKLDISYGYDAAGNKATIFIKQTQKNNFFNMPLDIDVYQGGTKKRYNFWIKSAADTFSFMADAKPDLINVDADKTLVCEKTDHKTAENFIFQYHHAGNYVDRREAIAFFLNHKEEPKGLDFLKTALGDKNDLLRHFILQRIDMKNDTTRKAMENTLINLAQKDSEALVRAAAITSLDTCKNEAFKALIKKAVYDSSYSIAGSALAAISKIDSVDAFKLAKELAAQPAKGDLLYTIATLFSKNGNEADYPFIYNHFNNGSLNNKFSLLSSLSDALMKETDMAKAENEVDIIANFRDNLPGFVANGGAGSYINKTLGELATAKKAAGASALAAYIEAKIPTGALSEK